MTIFLFLFTGCFGTKAGDTANAPANSNTCEQAREAYYDFASSLFNGLDYASCVDDNDCKGGTCRDICGVSCDYFIANTDNYDLIYDQLDQFAEENCQACSDYEYENYPEPELPPPVCKEGECALY